MSGGGQTTKSNTSTQNSLPSWLTPSYQGLANQANTLETTGQASGFAPMPVAPFSPLQNQGFSSIGGVDPTAIGAANNQLTNFASGQYLDPSTNPYLQDTFHQAANGVQNQIASEFAGNGRNVTASVPVQADAMNNLATNIYGGAYNTNMSNALQASGLAPGVTQGLFTPGQALLNAGAQQQQQQQQVLNAPYNTLSYYSQLMNGISSPFGQSTGSGTSTVQNNPSTMSQIGQGIGMLGMLGGFL
ncbi:MAG TPA: hypothetical protein VN660_01035 [Steroidobacteraceae bacterium]|nr:hypothetical protein [Steroidobacteraceae bacterium]